MSETEFQNLLQSCSEAREDYFHEAAKTCEMLGTCTSEPLSAQQKAELMAQRTRENAAHLEYRRVRERVLDAATLGYKDISCVIQMSRNSSRLRA
jgi:predicted anti-sigma-YlaC factor YlaD